MGLLDKFIRQAGSDVSPCSRSRRASHGASQDQFRKKGDSAHRADLLRPPAWCGRGSLWIERRDFSHPELPHIDSRHTGICVYAFDSTADHGPQIRRRRVLIATSVEGRQYGAGVLEPRVRTQRRRIGALLWAGRSSVTLAPAQARTVQSLVSQ
jgi:hypothetical protein